LVWNGPERPRFHIKPLAGVASGGYASGLAQALVLGLAAAESIAAG